MRQAEVVRDTSETQIRIKINLDGTGKQKLATGVPFLDHMLDQIARHGLIDLDIEAHGDTHIDDHHTVEDVGITLGQAVAKAVGDKKGIRRYGHSYVPLDEALSRVVIDFSGRPGLEFHVPFTRARTIVRQGRVRRPKVAYKSPQTCRFAPGPPRGWARKPGAARRFLAIRRVSKQD